MREYIITRTDYEVDEKANSRDLVSEVDIAVEKILTKHIYSLPGEQTILGEESNNDVDLNANHLWVIDPIDGTTNFVKQADDFGILVAYFEKGEAVLSYVYEIETDTLLSAQNGQGVFVNKERITPPDNINLSQALISINPRKMNGTELMTYLTEEAFDLRFLGSSVSDALRVFTGKYGAFVSPESMPWDRAPYLLIAKELELHLSQFNGKETTLEGDQNFYLGTKAIFEDLFGENSSL